MKEAEVRPVISDFSLSLKLSHSTWIIQRSYPCKQNNPSKVLPSKQIVHFPSILDQFPDSSSYKHLPFKQLLSWFLVFLCWRFNVPSKGIHLKDPYFRWVETLKPNKIPAEYWIITYTFILIRLQRFEAMIKTLKPYF